VPGHYTVFACLRALRVPDIFPIHQGDTTASSLGATLSRNGSAAPHSKPETQPKVVLGLANGLTGPFDIHLEVENPPQVDGGASEPRGGFSPFLAAIREQLGLQLDPGKRAGEFLVIDHVERPSES
jgi:hypothetical protein